MIRSALSREEQEQMENALRESMLRRKELAKQLPEQGGWNRAPGLLAEVERERKNLDQLAKDLGVTPSKYEEMRSKIAREVEAGPNERSTS
jgi:hypothetical protein